MRIPDEIRKCVVFIGYKDQINGEFVATGTGFFIGRSLTSDQLAAYLVTAEHNIQKIREQGALEVLVRVNLRTGATATWSIAHRDWTRNSRGADVAVLQVKIDENMDHKVFPIESLVSKERIEEEDIGVGTEVYITGLFKPHKGWAKNVPIIRVGAIAAMDEEKVSTSEHGQISAYLIEARSIGGLSGSPVMVHPPLIHIKDSNIGFAPKMGFSLLGLVHAHFDVNESKVDAVLAKQVEQINMGIAIVVPWYDILETLTSPSFLKAEMQQKQVLSFNKAAAEQLEAINGRLQTLGLDLASSDRKFHAAWTGAAPGGRIIISALDDAELRDGLLRQVAASRLF